MVKSADLFSHASLFISAKGSNNFDILYKDWRHNVNLNLNLPPLHLI